MDCGDGSACQALNDFVSNWFVPFSLMAWPLLQEHFEKLVGLAGFAFGAYRWWKYREHVLHERFEKYLLKSDERLFDGQSYVLKSLRRPGPGRDISLPLFAGDDLCSVFREKNWGRLTVRRNVLCSAQLQLADAAVVIAKRLETAEAGLSSLRRQLATTHILSGAIAAASAFGGSSATNTAALTSFKLALQVPGENKNPVAKELEAHQIRKLGDFPAALASYRQAERFAEKLSSNEERQLTIARVRRFQAEVLQTLSSKTDTSGQREFSGSLSAYRLLAGDKGDSVLELRSPFGPFQGWDQLEQGDIHYFTSFVAARLNFTDVAARHLSDASACYNKVLCDCDAADWHVADLRARASKGLELSQTAQSQKIYDVSWLCP